MLPPIKKIIKVLIDKNTDLVRTWYGGDTYQNLIRRKDNTYMIYVKKIFDFYQLFFSTEQNACWIVKKMPIGYGIKAEMARWCRSCLTFCNWPARFARYLSIASSLAVTAEIRSASKVSQSWVNWER